MGYHGQTPFLKKQMVDLAQIKAIIVEAVPSIEKDKITNEASFASLNIDSLDHMSIILSLQEQTNIQIPDEDIEKLTSAQNIADYFNNKL